jgi:drug/metabolite transporter (DMT)-like permease
VNAPPSYPVKAWIALGAVCIIWGTTYLANKVGVTAVPPLLFSGVRQLLAGGLILGWFILRGQVPWTDRGYLRFQSWLGFLLLTIGNGVGLVALTYMDSGIASLLSATTPILIVLFNLMLRSEDRLDGRGWAGILLGMAGVAYLSWDGTRSDPSRGYLWGLGFLLLALMGWAYGSVISKTRQWNYPVILSAGIQMLSGGLITLLLSLPLEDPREAVISPALIGSLIYLVLFGSLVAYSAYLYALSKLPATIVSLYAYINPLLALVAGWAFLDERLNHRVGVAALLILGGVYLVNNDFLRRRRRVRIP